MDESRWKRECREIWDLSLLRTKEVAKIIIEKEKNMYTRLYRLVYVFVVITAFFAKSQAQGPIVLMGIDAEDGGPGVHGPITVYEDVVDHILQRANVLGNGGSGILVIGGGKSNSDDVTRFWNEIDNYIQVNWGQSVAYVNGASDIATRSFAGFRMIAVVSSFSGTSSGGLTQAENSALANRRSDIANFVNIQKGGLLGFSQTGFSNPYEYLADVGTFNVNLMLSINDVTPTAVGLNMGITDDLDVCCWHDEYLVYPGFLEVLAIGADSLEVLAVGGDSVWVEPPEPEEECCEPCIPCEVQWIFIILVVLLLLLIWLTLRDCVNTLRQRD